MSTPLRDALTEKYEVSIAKMLKKTWDEAGKLQMLTTTVSDAMPPGQAVLYGPSGSAVWIKGMAIPVEAAETRGYDIKISTTRREEPAFKLNFERMADFDPIPLTVPAAVRVETNLRLPQPASEPVSMLADAYGAEVARAEVQRLQLLLVQRTKELENMTIALDASYRRIQVLEAERASPREIRVAGRRAILVDP